MSRTRLVPLLVIVSLFIIAIPATADLIADGDQALLENRFADAITAYAAVAADEDTDGPTHARAFRGMAAARQARDEGLEAVTACAQAILADPAHYGNVGLVKIMEREIQFSGVPEHWDDLHAQLREAAAGRPGLQEYLLDPQISALRARGRFEEANELFAGYACVGEFLIAGPFSNTGGSGIYEAYPPEHEIDEDATYHDRLGRLFQWEPSRDTLSGRVDFDLIFANEPDAVGYALTHVRANEDMPVVASVFGGDVFRLWINGEPVLRERTTRLPGWSLYEVPATLRAGWNRVLLKAASETDPLTFTLSFRDLEENALTLEADADADVYDGEDPPARPVPDDMSTYTFESLPEASWIRGWRDDVEEGGLAEWDAYLFFIMLHGFEAEMERALDECDERFPGSAVIAGQRAEFFSQTERPGEATATVRAAVDSAPEYAVGIPVVVFEALDKGELDPAWEMLVDALETNPDCLGLRASKASLMMARGSMTEGLAELEALYEEAPADMTVRMSYLTMLQVLGDEQRYYDALEDAFETRPDDSGVVGLLAGRAYAKGEYDAAISYLEHGQRAGDRVDIVALTKGAVYEQAGRADEALEQFEEGLRWSPRSTPLLESMARVLLQQGEEERAAEYFEECAARDPGAFPKLDLVRRLREQTPLTEFFPEEDVEEIMSADLSWVDPEAEAVRLLESQQVTLYESGSHEVRVHRLTKIFTRAGAEFYGDADVPYFYDDSVGQIEIARTIKADGREVEADRSYGSVSFADLEPGDFVEVRYLSRYRPTIGLPGHFWHRHFFQGGIPTLESRLAILRPEDVTYDTKLHGMDAAAVTTKHEDWRLDVWEMSQMPELSAESNMPPVTERCAWVDVSTVPDWTEIARWYEGVSRGRLVPGRDVLALAEELREGVTGDSSLIHVVTNYVREEIQYEDVGFIESGSIPRPVDEVLKTRLGDCKDQSVLIVSLLQSLGVEAKLALVNSTDLTMVPYLPSPSFSHAIVRAVTSDGKEYWIDPTEETMSFPNVPVTLEGAKALLVDSSGVSFLEIGLDPYDANGSDSFLAVEVDGEGGYAVDGHSTYRGEDASTYRFMAMYFADRLDEMARDIIASEHPAAVVGSSDLTGESDLDEDMVLTFEFKRAGAVSRAGNLSIFGVPWTIGRVPYDIVSLEERETPLVLESWRGHYAEEVELTLPAGYALQSELPLVELACDVGRFSITGGQREDGSIFLRKELDIDAQRVEVEQYAAFRSFLEEAWQAEGMQLVFSDG